MLGSNVKKNRFQIFFIIEQFMQIDYGRLLVAMMRLK